jgi:hypothetical protein
MTKFTKIRSIIQIHRNPHNSHASYDKIQHHHLTKRNDNTITKIHGQGGMQKFPSHHASSSHKEECNNITKFIDKEECKNFLVTMHHHLTRRNATISQNSWTRRNANIS